MFILMLKAIHNMMHYILDWKANSIYIGARVQEKIEEVIATQEILI